MRVFHLAITCAIVCSGPAGAQTWDLGGSELLAKASIAIPPSPVAVVGLTCKRAGVEVRDVFPGASDALVAYWTDGLLEFGVTPAAFPTVGLSEYTHPNMPSADGGADVEVAVDGRPIWSGRMLIDFERSELTLPVAPWGPLIDAMRRGNQLELSLDGEHAMAVGLGGSARAIDGLFDACGLNAASPVMSPAAVGG